MHPSNAIVKALVDEELSPGRSAIRVQAFVAHSLQFRAEEKRSMRIDEQQRVMVLRVRWRDRHTIRSARLVVFIRPSHNRKRHSLTHLRPVKRLQLSQVHPLDIAADAAFGKAERHPRLEMLNHARLHLWML